MTMSPWKPYFAASIAALTAAATIVSMTAAAAPARAYDAPSASQTQGDCGTLDMSTANSAAVRAAGDCIRSAFSHCETAQLRAAWQTSDETVERLITVAPGDSACSVLENVTRTPKAGGADSSDVFRCAGIRTTQDGIVVAGCENDGDVRIAGGQ